MVFSKSIFQETAFFLLAVGLSVSSFVPGDTGRHIAGLCFLFSAILFSVNILLQLKHK